MNRIYVTILFTGCTNSHWIDCPDIQPDNELQPKELPIWSVQTFGNRNPNSPLPPDQDIIMETTTTTTVANNSSNPLPMPSMNKKKVVPKRVAPPPPKNKNKKKGKITGSKPQHEPVEYAVPVNNHWYNRKKDKKPQVYKELDLTKAEGPSIYSQPAVKQ